MRKTDPSLLLFVILVLVSKAFTIPVDDPNLETTNDSPVIIPSEPLSKIVFVNDLLPGENLFDFARGAKMFVSSSIDAEAYSYEENIHILRPDIDGDVRKMNDIGKKINDETGEKEAVFETLQYRFTIKNKNLQSASFKNPGIIYFLLAEDEKHVNKVYESSRSVRRNIFVQSDNIDNYYITLINPSGAVRISNIHHIDGLTALTVSAGGLEETRSSDFTIHDIGKDAANTTSPLFLLEPVLTFHKQLALFPGSSFEITAKGVEMPTETVVQMNWYDWSLGMSRNYMLRNESNSFKYVFNASNENSQFDVQMFGEISVDSSLKISYDGIEGAGSESFQKRRLENFYKSMRGQKLIVEYQRGMSDTTKGVLVRVECLRPAAKLLLYSVFLTVLFKLLI
ncbi:unnamed protein product [Caenorhabditis brenneri]